MSEITNKILQKTKLLQVFPEFTPGREEFSAFNDGGVEIEVAEFLYTLVRMIKPNYIVETGTHLGISSLYMALALEENGNGALTTFEIIDILRQKAVQLWADLGISHRIQGILQSSLEPSETSVFAVVEPINFLFLDSEPQLRFNEFVKYWDLVVPGGFIAIHDLHPSVGHSGQVQHGTYDWPYGDFREKLGPYMKNLDVQTISFPTPRGFTLFQKRAKNMLYTRYILDESLEG